MTVSGRPRRIAPVIAGALAALAAAVSLLVFAGTAAAALSWSGPIARDAAGTGPAVTALACPSATRCAALDVGGGEVSFDPASPQDARPVAVDQSIPTATACPSATECVAVDASGTAVDFNPAAPGSVTSRAIDPGQILTAITCISTTECVAVDAAGDEVDFNPAAPTGSPAPAVHALDPGLFLSGVACFAPPSPSQSDCVAVDNASREVTFNTETGQISTESTIDYSGGSQASLTAVTCPPADSQCLAFDQNGTEITFSPTGGSITSFALDAGNGILAATCPAATECVAIDSAGGEMTFPPGERGVRAVVDPSKSLSALACTSATTCVAGDEEGQAIPFDPASGSASDAVLIDAVGSYSAVACSSATQCTAADTGGDVETFNPRNDAVIASSLVDPGAVTVYSMSCPSATQCTLVDQNGNEATFNPVAPGSPVSKSLVQSHTLLGVACPSTTQCTAVDDDRDEITFNPQAPGQATYALLSTPAGTAITGVACPSLTQCTAVDGIGEAVTFDPRAPGRPPARQVLSGAAVGVACPTTSECVAIDASGHRATFAPGDPGGAVTASVDASQPSAVACLTATYCALIDTSGRAVEFDPRGDGAFAGHSLGADGSLTGLACGSSESCVAVATSGSAFSGHAALPSVPRSVAAPAIRGKALEGDRLTATSGRWSAAPTSYYPQWQRCTARGTSCRPIRGATNRTYVLTAADVGHEMRLSEVVADQAGRSAAALSAKTGKIKPSRMPPRVSGLSFSDLLSGHAEVRVTLTSARYGPLLRQLSVSLPSGIRLPQRGRGTGVSHRGHTVPATLRVIDGSQRISLRRQTTAVEVALRSLVVSAALKRRLRRHQVKTLTLTVGLSGPGGRWLRTRANWRVR